MNIETWEDILGSTRDWYHLPITETDDLALSSADLRKVLNKGRSIWENECFSLDFWEEKAKPRGLPGGGVDWVAREGLQPGGGALGAGVGSVGRQQCWLYSPLAVQGVLFLWWKWKGGAPEAR